MSNWEIYQLLFQLNSPLHIGDRKLGVVNLTKHYIPSINFFSALVSISAKNLMKCYYPVMYEILKERFKDNIFFTNFYPYNLTTDELYLPLYTDNGLNYWIIRRGYFIDKKPVYEFENEYIISYTSTEINHSTLAHKDDSLHEIEFLKSGLGFMGYLIFEKKEWDLYKWFNDFVNGCTNSDVYQIDIFEKELEKRRDTLLKSFHSNGKLNINFELIKKWLDQLKYEGIGGEKSRGAGKISFESCSKLEDNSYLFFKEKQDRLKKEGYIFPRLCIDKLENKPVLKYELQEGETGKCLILHPIDITLIGLNIKEFIGDIRPDVGRIWSNRNYGGKKYRGAGQCLEYRGVKVEAGSVIKSGSFTVPLLL